jgi:probable LLM family oxidoreductase
MELGLATFADLSSGVSPGQRMRELIEEAVLADQLGLEVFAIGEHHRRDFLISSPVVALAAIAAKTQRIRLSSAVTVLSSDDPVRVFQQFAELDLISNGRAEVMAGRGSFIESFPLFGYDLDDYDELFAEKLELLLAIREQEQVTWSGRHRAPLSDATIWPRPVQQPLPVWVAVGGTPQSVVRAGGLGLPLTLAIIGGQPERFVPLVKLYRRAADASGHTTTKLAINTHAFVAPTSQEADAAFAPSYLAMMNRIGRERGWPPSGRREYEALRSPRGALAVGSPDQVAEKILFEHDLFGHQRYLAQMSVGAVAHRDVMRSIELFGTEVAPRVRAALPPDPEAALPPDPKAALPLDPEAALSPDPEAALSPNPNAAPDREPPVSRDPGSPATHPEAAVP